MNKKIIIVALLLTVLLVGCDEKHEKHEKLEQCNQLFSCERHLCRANVHSQYFALIIAKMEISIANDCAIALRGINNEVIE